jgi:hypothetical protein
MAPLKDPEDPLLSLLRTVSETAAPKTPITPSSVAAVVVSEKAL